MNKYMGFYELKDMCLPTVPWRLFTTDTDLDGGLLWTVRVAVERSTDLNLPRAVGVSADEAMQKGREFLSIYDGKGIVLYYPYFIAQKSGVIEMDNSRTVIEAVDKDLWNLVTHGQRNVTAIFPFGTSDREDAEFFGDGNFLRDGEINELLGYGNVLRGKFREEISGGGSIIAEWSYAFNTDTGNKPIGERYLVFYELRGV